MTEKELISNIKQITFKKCGWYANFKTLLTDIDSFPTKAY